MWTRGGGGRQDWEMYRVPEEEFVGRDDAGSLSEIQSLLGSPSATCAKAQHKVKNRTRAGIPFPNCPLSHMSAGGVIFVTEQKNKHFGLKPRRL